MANKGLSMRKVREVLRLHHHVAGLSGRAIARSLKLSPVTVTRYIRRAEEAGLSWPLPESLDDAQLERRLLPGAASMPGETRFPVPEWSTVHRELRRKGVTLALLWQEYKETHPEGMQYSRFCQMYRAWAAKLDVVMRFEHRAGEKTFVDYAGHTVGVGEQRVEFLLEHLEAKLARRLMAFQQFLDAVRKLFEHSPDIDTGGFVLRAMGY